ncbi:hypothetical protein B0H15DRAFT_952838 [Mycena belliarum]|uniref:Uncharacterized protein n=1 Tax=Mycena belliarum TaxID=1033014 RepID=A0AAD6TY93_9AGAR|nr:hypothetical protein B0H15DRAFT_952838 [Mycena belliae]
MPSSPLPRLVLVVGVVAGDVEVNSGQAIDTAARAWLTLSSPPPPTSSNPTTLLQPISGLAELFSTPSCSS